MSLQVWLPLMEDLHNQGLSNITFNWLSSPGENINFSSENSKFNSSYHIVTDGTNFIAGNDIISSITENSGISLTGWIRLNNLEIDHFLFGLSRYSSANSFFRLYIKDLTFYVYFNGYNTFNYPNQIDTNWHHYAVTYGNSKLSFYLDGELVDTKTKTINFNSNRTKLFIGSRLVDNSQSLEVNGCDAYFNDIRVYNHCLNQKEVNQLSQGLMIRYMLNDVNTQKISNLLTKDQSYCKSGWNVYNSADSNVEDITQSSIVVDGYNTLECSGQKPATNKRSMLNVRYRKVDHNDLVFLYGDTYIFSCLIRAKDINNTYPSMGKKILVGIQGRGDSGYTSIIKKYEEITLTNKWQRVSAIGQIFTNDSEQIGTEATSLTRIDGIVEIPSLNSGEVDNDNIEFYIACPMLEKAEYPSPIWIPGNEEYLNNKVYDSSGYNNDTSFYTDAIGAIKLDGPRVQKALSFSSGTNYSMIRKQINYNNPTEFTISCWIKYNNIAESRCPIRFYPYGSTSNKILQIYTSYFYFRSIDEEENIDGSSTSICSSSALRQIGIWNHVCITFKDNIFKGYVNGQLVNTKSIDNNKTFPGIDYVYLGGSTSDAGFDGSLSDFRFYTTALNENEVKELML